MPPSRPSHPFRRLATATLLTIFLLGSLAPAVPAAESREAATTTVTALAVAQTDQGFEGSHATVTATVLRPGDGEVFVATKPLALQDMQGSARLASKVAARTAGADWAAHDYLVSFHSGSAEIGGPSAGAAMALALAAALHNLAHPDDPWELDPKVAVTGTINPDGTVGPVGGIPAKAEAAAAAGVTLFLYPVGLERAPTLVPGRFGPQQAIVDMADHCEDLGIECRAVSSLHEVVAAAAHVELREPAAPVPDTRDYSAQLGGPTTAQMDALEAMERDTRAALADAAGLPAADRGRLAQELDGARGDLADARAAYQEGAYYLAATDAFQGRIAARMVQAELDLRARREAAAVEEALAACDEAIEEADRAAPRDADTATAAWALGAARVRLDHARELRAEAEAAYRQAFSLAGWAESVRTSAFCVERAGTVSFWAGLADAFPPGPALDVAAAAGDAIDEAAELVAYSASVLGRDEAAAELAQARRLLEAGEPAAALVAATQAQAAALVALQTGAGIDIPPQVLDNARASASRAVAQARADGAEPILPVSLVELASTQEPAEALRSLWEARTLALVASGPGPAPLARRTGEGGEGVGVPAAPSAALAAALAAVAWTRRRRGA